MSSTMAASRVTMRGPNGGGLKDAIELADASETSFWCPFCEGAQIGTDQDPPKPGAQCSKCGAHVVDVKPVRLERTEPAAAPDPEPARRCAVCDGFIGSDEQSEWKLDGRPVHNICAGVVHPLVRRIEELEEELAASRKAYDELVASRVRAASGISWLLAELDAKEREIEQMRGANEAHHKLLEEARQEADRRYVADLRRAQMRARYWERKADRLGRIAIEALRPDAHIDDPLPEPDRTGPEAVPEFDAELSSLAWLS